MVRFACITMYLNHRMGNYIQCVVNVFSPVNAFISDSNGTEIRTCERSASPVQLNGAAGALFISSLRFEFFGLFSIFFSYFADFSYFFGYYFSWLTRT